jgi:hypothetical protein
MSRALRLPGPLARNLLVYHKITYEKCKQADLAKSFQLTQGRISQIARQAKAWVDTVLPVRFFKRDHGLRFHMAIAHERMRLNDAYDPLIATFTGSDGFPRHLRRYTTVVAGEPLTAIEISDKPDFHLLNQTIDVVGRMAQLEKIANLGPFADLPNQMHRTTVHRREPATKGANETANAG